jgi:hypothetical protein
MCCVALLEVVFSSKTDVVVIPLKLGHMNCVVVFFHTDPPLWSSGQSSRLQIQMSGFDSRHYQIFLEVVGLERGSTQSREYN